jgi:ABC-type transport system substrate-binding protein
MEPRDHGLSHRQLNRRRLLAMAGAGGVTLAGAHWEVTSPSSALAQEVQLPADAAPLEQQVRIWASPSQGRSMDWAENVYGSAPLSNLFNEPLVRLTKDYEVVPGAASAWENSGEGRIWTFTIKQGLKWNDDTDLTAADWLATMQYMADPAHAWDAPFFWQGVIRNYTEAIQGTVAPTDIGVRVGDDAYTLIFETVDPVPYLPAVLIYSWPLQAKALQEYGSGVYNTNPETSVSSGPYMLEEFAPDRRIVLVANPKYTGDLKPLIQRLIANIVPSGQSNFPRYLANEIDQARDFNPAELKQILGDPELSAQLTRNAGDFRSFYLFFDVTQPPWDNLAVRQAFSKAVDREALINALLAPLALPAYSFLAPGYPDADSEGLKPIQDYDPEAAKAKLAEAGYPDGQGFPSVTLYVRGGGPPTDGAITQAIAANFKDVLGVDVELETQDQPTFMTNLNAKPTQIPFGWISFGTDYLDATSMLNVFKSGGRHSWSNAQYDQLLKEGAPLSGDPERRSQMMKDAERVLVEDVPAIWVYHQLIGELHKQ